MEWKNIYRGMVMGMSDVVPGVSGGTIAVILGFYDQLIGAINGLFSKEWKKHLSFLVPLAIGVALSLFSFGKLMNWLLSHHEQMTYYFFLGLIIGILPYLLREGKVSETFKWYHVLILICGIILICLIPTNVKESAVITEMTFSTYLLLFFSGILASAAMILPGISGSFVLLVIGVYRTVLDALITFDLKIIFIVAIGIGIGIVTMSKAIHYCLQNFRTATFAMIIGLVIGSIYVIFPGWATDIVQFVYCLIIFASGLFIAYVLGRIEY